MGRVSGESGGIAGTTASFVAGCAISIPSFLAFFNSLTNGPMDELTNFKMGGLRRPNEKHV